MKRAGMPVGNFEQTDLGVAQALVSLKRDNVKTLTNTYFYVFGWNPKRDLHG